MKIFVVRQVEFFWRIIYNGVMKDLIAERDKKQKMQQSVVKWWNVHYMTPEELAEEQEKEVSSAMSQPEDVSEPSDNGEMIQEPEEENVAEVSDTAQDILDRLNREAAEDEARKQREIEEVRLAAEANFNETTGAYSGGYGASGADGEHKEKIDAILAEKDDALRDLIERTGEE